MSLKRKIISAVTSAFAIIAFTTFISAQETNTDTQKDTTQKREWRGKKDGKRDGMRRGFRGGRGGGMLRGIELTDTQKEQVRTIMESKKAGFQATREEFRTLKQAKRDGSITAEQQTRLDALKQQMKADAKQTHEQIMAILTPEQRTEIEKRKAEMKQRREEFRQKRQEKQQNPQTEQKDNN